MSRWWGIFDPIPGGEPTPKPKEKEKPPAKNGQPKK